MKRSLVLGLILIMTTGVLSSCHTVEGESRANTPASVDDKLVATQNDLPETATSEEKDGKNVFICDADKLSYNYTEATDIPLEKGAYIAVVAKGMDSGYWKTVQEGAERAIDELNTALGYTGKDKIKMTFEGPDNSTDIDAQINTIDTVLAENPSVLCLSAIDMTSCEPQLETAEENGIPVVIIDSGVQKNDKVDLACETNNREAGAEAAKRLCESIGDSGEVAVISQVKLAQNAVNRVEGFQEEIEKNHPNVKVVATTYEDAVTEDNSGKEAITVIMDQLAQEHPDLSGIFYTNEGVGNRVLDYLDKSDLDLKLVGFDSGTKQQQAIKDGKLEGVISQNPYCMGYVSIIAAARLSADLPIDQYINTGYQWVDADNIDDADVKDYLYK